MSTAAPPPDIEAEVLDLNAEARVMDASINPSVAAQVSEGAMAAESEAPIQLLSPVEALLDDQGEVLAQEQLGKALSEALAMRAKESVNAGSFRNRETESEAIINTGTETIIGESEFSAGHMDITEENGSFSLRIGTLEENLPVRDAVVAVEAEDKSTQPTRVRTRDQEDGSFVDEASTQEVFPENPSVEASIADSSGANLTRPLHTSGNGNCGNDQVEGTGQKFEERGTTSVKTHENRNKEKTGEAENKSIFKSFDSDVKSDEVSKHVSYDLAFEDKPSFSVSDLVWGKVKSHPWWPGQIFDPSNASDMARKHQKKDHLLVAYFGDKTFAWCDVPKLKPFYRCFSQLANQSSSETFVAAVDNALTEVSRRIEFSMSCNYMPEKVFHSLKRQKIDNAGLSKGSFERLPGNTFFSIDFQSSKFLRYVRAIAQYPGEVIDRLELAIAKSQMIAFNRFRGMAEDLVARDLDNVNTKLADTKKHSDNVKETASGVTNSVKYVDDGFAFDLPGSRKRKRLDALGDVEIKTPNDGKSFKVGECISRVASRLKGSHAMVKCNGQNHRKGHNLNNVFEVCSNSGEVPEGQERDRSHSPKEMLSQLTFVARDPIEGHSYLSTIIPFFKEIRELRDSVVDEPLINIKKRRGKKKLEETSGCPGEEESVEKVPKKRGRKKKSESNCGNPSHRTDESGEKVKKKRGRKKTSDVVENPKSGDQAFSPMDYMTDSYWTDGLADTSPGFQKRRGQQTGKSNSNKKSKFLQEHLPLSKMMEKAHHLQINAASPEKRDSAVFFGDRRLEDSAPTALILSFNEWSAVPSETNLVRIFSRYGPLKEAETVVSRETKSAKVVFKKRADAEAAFSNAGKYRIFGPALLSFRLKSPPSPFSSPQPCINDQLPDEAMESTVEHVGEADQEQGKASEMLPKEEELNEEALELTQVEELKEEAEKLTREAELKEEAVELRREEAKDMET